MGDGRVADPDVEGEVISATSDARESTDAFPDFVDPEIAVREELVILACNVSTSRCERQMSSSIRALPGPPGP